MFTNELLRSSSGSTNVVLGGFAMEKLIGLVASRIAIVILTPCLLGQLQAAGRPLREIQLLAVQTRSPIQALPASSGQLLFQNVGQGSGTIQLNGGDIITCESNSTCTSAFVVRTGETISLSATAQCNTSYFVQFSLPCSSGGSTTRPGQGYCSFVNHSNTSQYPIQMTVLFNRVPTGAKPPIACK
jgi:hypothetical protein